MKHNLYVHFLKKVTIVARLYFVFDDCLNYRLIVYSEFKKGNKDIQLISIHLSKPSQQATYIICHETPKSILV
jgi:hypothetical protein